MLLSEAFLQLKIHQNAFAAGDLTRTQLGELTIDAAVGWRDGHLLLDSLYALDRFGVSFLCEFSAFNGSISFPVLINKKSTSICHIKILHTYANFL